MLNERMAIIDGGNLGSEIARGLVTMGVHAPGSITITRRSEPSLAAFEQEGFGTTTDNAATVWDAAVVLVAVRPKQMNDVLEGIAPVLDPGDPRNAEHQGCHRRVDDLPRV